VVKEPTQGGPTQEKKKNAKMFNGMMQKKRGTLQFKTRKKGTKTLFGGNKESETTPGVLGACNPAYLPNRSLRGHDTALTSRVASRKKKKQLGVGEGMTRRQ